MTDVEQRHDNPTTEQSWEDVAIPSQQAGDGQVARAAPPTDADLELGPLGIPPERRARLIERLDAHLRERRDHMLGYQVTEDMDAYREDLSRFMRMHLNNIGDPFQEGGYKVNTKPVERAVLRYFAKLWHGTPYKPGKRDSCWGYALSMGATEGNLYAVWNARDYLEGKRLLVPPDAPDSRPVTYIEPMMTAAAADGDPNEKNRFRPIIFYSQDTHYSFAKAVRVLKLPTFSEIGRKEYPNECPLGGDWPDEVPSALPSGGLPGDQYPAFGPGSIDVDKLVTLVRFFAEKKHPIVVNLNYGSTFKCAYDDVRAVCDKLVQVFDECGLLSREIAYEDGEVEKRRGFWIHVDGALGAGYMPFLAMAEKDPKYGYTPEVPIPEFDFGLKSAYVRPGGEPVEVDMVASIALSGHKWMGAPWPCGLLLTKVKYQMQPPGEAEYIGALDTTFAGSRNGFSPLVMWDYLAQHPNSRQISKAVHSQRMAAYLVEQLKKVERYWQKMTKNKDLSLYIDRSPLAITVRFRRPSSDIVAKYSLSTVSLQMRPTDGKKRRHLAHAFLMSFTTQDRIDAFVLDLFDDDAFDFDTDGAVLRSTSRYDTAVPPAQFPFEDRGFA
jgi:histidine decarboxylase